jgi:hypothetical protein
MLLRAGMSGSFAGSLAPAEQLALKTAFLGHTKIQPMANDAYKILQAEHASMPLRFSLNSSPSLFEGAGTVLWPEAQLAKGKVPLIMQDYTKPGLTAKQAKDPGLVRDYINTAAMNHIADWNMDPKLAQSYAEFYPRINREINALDIPTDRASYAFAALSPQKAPDVNAALLEKVLTDPTGRHTTQDEQIKALRFLSGRFTNPEEILGQTKTNSFAHNIFEPDNPNWYTADTINTRSAGGLYTPYKQSQALGQFSIPERYKLYTEPGILAAQKLGLKIPNRGQAGWWGNFRNFEANNPIDLPESLFTQNMKNLSYDEDKYIKRYDREDFF